MSHPIGINLLLWSTHITPEHLPVIEALAELGFDGVEIPVGAQDESQLTTLAARCDELGLRRTCSGFVGEDSNPISPDAGIRAAALENLKRTLDGTAILGGEILVGGLYQAHKYFTGRGATQEEWDWSAEYLRAGGEYAASLGINLGLEFLNRFEVFLINTTADCRRMVETVGLDNVGIHYDTHHANIEDPAPELALAHGAAQINHVHFSESHRGTLGTGQVDWSATARGLASAGYDGWVVIEAFGTADPVLAAGANVWRNAFDSPQQLARDGLVFIRQLLGE